MPYRARAIRRVQTFYLVVPSHTTGTGAFRRSSQQTQAQYRATLLAPSGDPGLREAVLFPVPRQTGGGHSSLAHYHSLRQINQPELYKPYELGSLVCAVLQNEAAPGPKYQSHLYAAHDLGA
jgi:hypothetical protein